MPNVSLNRKRWEVVERRVCRWHNILYGTVNKSYVMLVVMRLGLWLKVRKSFYLQLLYSSGDSHPGLKRCLATVVVVLKCTESVTSSNSFQLPSWDQRTRVGLSLPLAENQR